MSAVTRKNQALYRNITCCRVCQSGAMVDCMDFGEQYLASNFVRSNEGLPLSQVRVPLTVVLCQGCGILQLRESVDRDLLYRDYFYRSGTNPMMRHALKDVADDIMSRTNLGPGDIVVDIGCNDGTMLSYFSQEPRRIGIEPATNINWGDLDPEIHIINDFFSRKRLEEDTGGAPCQVVTSIAMMYGVEDLNAFCAQVKSVLAPGGVWCIQLSYLPAIISNMSFYDVCHEHLYYFSLTTLDTLLELNGLSIYDASLNDVNGGSLRVFATHKENRAAKTEAYHRILADEEQMELTDADYYHRFFEQVNTLKGKVTKYLRQEADQGNLVVGLGASTKGNVLLQFFDIDKKLVPYISERNPEKVSLRTLGTDIELVSEEQARQLNPSTMLVLIWFFKDEIIKREGEYLEKGGKLLFPMPYPHLLTKHGETAL